MIYTLTVNPSIDYIVHTPDLQLGKVNRTTKDMKFPGGKGINVSRILSTFHIKNIAFGFLGGFTGDYIEAKLHEHGIQTDFVKITDDSRINIKIKANEETEINGTGPFISEDELSFLFHKLSALTTGDILVLAGSIQKTLPATLYVDIQKNPTLKRD